jgi:hypothetical protein
MRKPTVLLRWISRFNFCDSLVLVFLILGALWLLHFVVSSAHGQGFPGGFVSNSDAERIDKETRERQAMFDAGRIAALRQPIRIINGHEENIGTAPGWCHFHGKVINVLPDGINVYGFFSPLHGQTPHQAVQNVERGEIMFFVTHFPRDLAEGDEINVEDWAIAKDVGIHTYKSPMRGPRGIHHLDYGTLSQTESQITHQPNQADMDALLADARKRRAEMDALQASRAAAATNSPPLTNASAAVATNAVLAPQNLRITQ